MKKLTVKEIEKKLFEKNKINETLLESLRQDARKGVQHLIKKWDKQQDAERKLQEKFDRMFALEIECKQAGYTSIAGIDEVGRGPLAGPVVSSAVILGRDFYLPGLNDSKKLTEEQREYFYEKIFEQASAIGTGIVSPREIDELNIYQATKKAMKQAVLNLPVQPDFLLVDAMDIPIHIPQKKYIKGDEKSISIAASSVVAKVTRDRIMKELALKYPQYGFESHMGYGTAKHLEAIEQFGITNEHRRSFAPIKNHLIQSDRLEGVKL